MSTYLQICQKVARESGEISGVLPSTTASQSGKLLKIVNWVSDAWKDIQTEREEDWFFLNREFSGKATGIGTARYSSASWGLTDWAFWRNVGRFWTIYNPTLGLSDTSDLSLMPYEDWFLRYGRGAQTPNRPSNYAIDPAGQVCLGPVPDAVYSIQGAYQRIPQVLGSTNSPDTEVPICPDRHHDAITWRAMILLVEHSEATIPMATARARYATHIVPMQRTQLPAITISQTPIA